MADKVKPLKIESATTGGTQNDPNPVETDPLQDYLTAYGLAARNSDAFLIDVADGSNWRFIDAIITGGITLTQLRTALNNTFSNTSNGFTATNVQAAIEEARNSVINQELTSNTSITCTTSVAVMTGMTVTPAAGEYQVIFCSAIQSATAGQSCTVALYVNGVAQSGTSIVIRPYDGGLTSAANATGGVFICKQVTVTGTQAIDIRWVSTGTTNTAADRTLNILRIS